MRSILWVSIGTLVGIGFGIWSFASANSTSPFKVTVYKEPGYQDSVVTYLKIQSIHQSGAIKIRALIVNKNPKCVVNGDKGSVVLNFGDTIQGIILCPDVLTADITIEGGETFSYDFQ